MYAERRKFSISLATDDGRRVDGALISSSEEHGSAREHNEFFQAYPRRLRRHRVRYWWRGELRAKALHDGIDRR